jgi:hypothetical protein
MMAMMAMTRAAMVRINWILDLVIFSPEAKANRRAAALCVLSWGREFASPPPGELCGLGGSQLGGWHSGDAFWRDLAGNGPEFGAPEPGLIQPIANSSHNHNQRSQREARGRGRFSGQLRSKQKQNDTEDPRQKQARNAD